MVVVAAVAVREVRAIEEGAWEEVETAGIWEENLGSEEAAARQAEKAGRMEPGSLAVEVREGVGLVEAAMAAVVWGKVAGAEM